MSDVDAVARAICLAQGDDFDLMDDGGKEGPRYTARAAIEALRNLGWMSPEEVNRAIGNAFGS